MNCTDSVQTQVDCSLTLVVSDSFLSLAERVNGFIDKFLTADICVIYVTYYLCPQNQNVSTLHSSNLDYFSSYSSNSGAGLWPFASKG
jgi:membrane-bound acyltransferase YfiQ involved in biofilm formation